MKKKYSGTLLLVVGNSGSGKDSIISGAMKKYPSHLKQVFLTKRYITRPASKFEDNYSITEEKFNQMKKNGKFSLHWVIYGLNYGVPIEIEDWLKNGHPVIVNVSRNVVSEARAKYDNVKVIFIEVPFEITLKRIKNRGREEGERLKERIERARKNQTFPSADFVVDNSGDLDDAVEQFLKYLIKIVGENED